MNWWENISKNNGKYLKIFLYIIAIAILGSFTFANVIFAAMIFGNFLD